MLETQSPDKGMNERGYKGHGTSDSVPPAAALSLSLTLLLRGVFAMPWFRRNVLTRYGLSPWASVHFQPPVSKVKQISLGYIEGSLQYC